MERMPFIYNDGGRAAAGYHGKTGDCFVRAFAIASGRPYQEIYTMLFKYAASERPGSKRRKGRRSNPKSGIWKPTARKIARDLGAVWTPTMTVGSGCKVHLAAGELPSGRLVAAVSRHYTAVIDGVVNDTYDPQRDPEDWYEMVPGKRRENGAVEYVSSGVKTVIGGRCVYGYWTF